MGVEHTYKLEAIVTRMKRSYAWLKFQEKIFAYQLPRYRPMYARAFARYKACRDKKPAEQIRKELALCRQYWGCDPAHYYFYDLYRDDRILSEEQLLDYVPHYFFWVLFWDYHYSPRLEVLANDKIIEEQYLGSLGIAMPHAFCRVVKQRYYDQRFNEMGFHALMAEVAVKLPAKIFVKPRLGHCGDGIHIFNRTRDGGYISQSDQVFSESWMRAQAKGQDWIIQPGLVQEAFLSDIYPHALNTVRVITRHVDGKASVLCALLRMGRGGVQVDNAAKGGIFVKVDIDTGAFDAKACSTACEYFTAHPDTGFVFRGKRMADWERVKGFSMEIARKMPDFPYLGMDIALTRDGVVVLEIITAFSIEICQIACGGMRRMLGINEVAPYWRGPLRDRLG